MEEEENSRIFHDFLSKIGYNNYSDISWCFRNQQNEKFLEWLTKNISSSNYLTKEQIKQYNEMISNQLQDESEFEEEEFEEEDEITLQKEIQNLEKEYKEIQKKNEKEETQKNQILEEYKKIKSKTQMLDLHNIVKTTKRKFFF